MDIFSAKSITNFVSCSSGTQSLISEILFASLADIVSPVKSIFIEFFWLTFLERATIGVEQKSPMLTPGVANFEESDETAKSHDATN